MKIWFNQMMWQEVKDALRRSGGIAIVPTGSTEQHGLHLSKGTDAMCTIAIADSRPNGTVHMLRDLKSFF